jgi:hypothetical protein
MKKNLLNLQKDMPAGPPEFPEPLFPEEPEEPEPKK